VLNENATILKQAGELEVKAKTAISLSQEIEASKEVEQSLALLDTLKTPSAAQNEEATGIRTRLTEEADTLTKTTRFAAAAEQYSFTGTPQTVFTSLPFFYGFTANNGSLIRTGKGEKSVTQASIPLPAGNDTIVSITGSNESDTSGYVLTRQQKVYRIVQSGSDTLLRTIAPSSGDFAYGDVIGSYNGNVYILDGQTGLLWKYANSGTVYAKGVSVIDSTKYDIKKSISLAIDGSIYLLKQDGSLLKFTGGQQEKDFTLKDMPYLVKKMIQPLQVVSDDGMNSIYILDGGITSAERSTARILEFTKSGTYIRQYSFPDNLTKVTAFSINPKDKKLWVLNADTVHEFDL
jgi:hypothetical protein